MKKYRDAYCRQTQVIDAMREALEGILEPADIVFGEEFDTCRYCGRNYTDENIERAENGENPLYVCPSDDCLGFKARAALALAKGSTRTKGHMH